MPHIFDISEVRASLDAFLSSEKHKTELPGYDGVVARCQHAVLVPITIWRTEEFNRGIDQNTIMNAIVGMCASTIAGEVTENSPPGDIDAAFGMVNRVLAALAEEIGVKIMSGPAAVINSVEAGNA